MLCTDEWHAPYAWDALERRGRKLCKLWIACNEISAEVCLCITWMFQIPPTRGYRWGQIHQQNSNFTVLCPSPRTQSSSQFCESLRSLSFPLAWAPVMFLSCPQTCFWILLFYCPCSACGCSPADWCTSLPDFPEPRHPVFWAPEERALLSILGHILSPGNKAAWLVLLCLTPSFEITTALASACGISFHRTWV